MRVRWEFFIECTGIRFERVHKFEAEISEKHSKPFGLPVQEFTALITIEPDEKSYNPAIEQTGLLKITLPGNNEQTKDFAYWLSRQVARQITFSQGEVKVVYGLVTGEHLPDTLEEAEQLAEGPYFYEARLVEVLPTPSFDGSSLEKLATHPLIEQFNAANKAKNPIDRFLGLFRILEDLYGPTAKKVTLAEALKASAELLQIAQKHLHVAEDGNERPLTHDDFTGLVDSLVHARHECAHLRSSKGFGVTHGDPRVTTEIEPLTGPLRDLTYEAIQMRL
jgi:hypothetical protein